MSTSNPNYADFFPLHRKSRLPGGYMGKILRVDLSLGKFIDLNLPEEPLLRKYWGGQLFAEYVLLNELPLNIDPYDSKNVIVGMTGPITGTGLTPGGTKTCFVYLSPATRYTLGRAATSGYFGTSLKAAGYDGVIITGAAQQPTYLYVGEDKIELRDASGVWGKGVRDTETTLRTGVGSSGRARRRHWPGGRKPYSRCHVRQRLQPYGGSWLGRGDGLQKVEGHCRLGYPATADCSQK